MRERAVRMLLEHQHEYPSQWKAIAGPTFVEELQARRAGCCTGEATP